jgi:TatA/E family protein of Tat protein translocase
MFGLGWQEILLILLLALLLFGGKKLPGIAKSLGRSVQEFKKGIDPAAKHEDDDGDNEDETAKPEKKEEPKKELPEPEDAESK